MFNFFCSFISAKSLFNFLSLDQNSFWSSLSFSAIFNHASSIYFAEISRLRYLFLCFLSSVVFFVCLFFFFSQFFFFFFSFSKFLSLTSFFWKTTIHRSLIFWKVAISRFLWIFLCLSNLWILDENIFKFYASFSNEAINSRDMCWNRQIEIFSCFQSVYF